MTTTRVLLVEAAGPESGALVETAVARGYQIHAVTVPEQFASYSTELRTALSSCLRTDLSRPELAVDDILGYARRIGVDAVLTTNEYLTPLVAEICAALDLHGNDAALAGSARSKASMARQFGRCGVTAPVTYVLSHESDMCRLAASGQLTFPCVVKPTEGAGSVGVTVVTNGIEATAAFRAVQKRRGMYAMVLDPRVGDTVNGTEDNTGRLGSFIVVGPDQQRVDRHADHLLTQVRIDVEPFEPSGHLTDQRDPQ